MKDGDSLSIVEQTAAVVPVANHLALGACLNQFGKTAVE